MDRREFLGGVGAASAVALAGCPGSPPEQDVGEYVPTEPNYQGWFTGVSNYRGTIDARGQEEYRVKVGVKGANGFYYFGPVAVAVSPGTRVLWEWTGRGGTHNVVSTSGAFTSGKPVDREGHTFATTLEDPGVYRYVCTPHQALGMKGAVYVSLGAAGDAG